MPLGIRSARSINSFTRRVPPLTQRWFSAGQTLRSEGEANPETLFYPEVPSSAKHHDLDSFLRYTTQSGLDTTSTTYIGTHFEYTVADSLSKHGFHLRRVGGASDNGIDLLGTWTVPSAPKPLRVLVQCKALSRKTGPHLVRELEGAFAGAPVGWRGPGVIGLLVTERPATQGTREALGRSRSPMGFVSCTRAGILVQLLWNPSAQDQGLEGVEVRAQHVPVGAGGAVRLALTFKGGEFSQIAS